MDNLYVLAVEREQDRMQFRSDCWWVAIGVAVAVVVIAGCVYLGG